MKIADWYTGKDRTIYIKKDGDITTFSFSNRSLNININQQYIFNKDKKYSVVFCDETIELHEDDK